MNKKYLKFLFKEPRIVLIFFFILYFGISLTPNLNSQSGPARLSDTLLIAGVMSMILTYVLPVLLLAFIHRRRSADLYLALPISRKQQLITTLLFCFGIAFGYFLVTALISTVVTGCLALFPKVLLVIAHAAFMTAVMILINSALYLIANNLFDGIVMLGAYTGMPLVFLIALAAFVDTMVAGAGMNTFDGLDGIIMYTSPLMMNMSTFFSLAEFSGGSSQNAVSAAYVLLPLLYGAAACFLLKIHFISRPSERAEQVSNDILAYPAAIHICLFMALITLATALVESSLRTVAVFFLLLLLVYVTAMFVYKRSLKLEKKPFIIFTAMSLLCILFCRTAWNTKCFGLAEKYDLRKFNETENLVYQYSRSFNSETMNIGEKEMMDEYDFDKYYSSVRFDLKVPAGRLDEYQEAVAIIERFRKERIAEYYAKDTEENASPARSYLFFCTSIPAERNEAESTSHHYNYYSVEPLSEAELLAIDRFTPVIIEEYDEKTYEWAEIPLKTYLERRQK